MSMHELISDSQRLWFRPEWLLEDDDSDQNHDNDNGFHRAVICLWIWKMEGRDLQQKKEKTPPCYCWRWCWIYFGWVRSLGMTLQSSNIAFAAFNILVKSVLHFKMFDHDQSTLVWERSSWLNMFWIWRNLKSLQMASQVFSKPTPGPIL